MANYIALELGRCRMAEMSCIAGIGGDVPSLLKIAHSKRPLIAIDGCPIGCAKQCLARHGLKADTYLQLSRYEVKKCFPMAWLSCQGHGGNCAMPCNRHGARAANFN